MEGGLQKQCFLMITFVFCPQFIALVLICVAVYAKVSTKITIDISLPIVGGVIACGVFLLLVAIMGVAGAIRHSQVILFFVSFTLRLLLFSVIVIGSYLKDIHLRISCRLNLLHFSCTSYAGVYIYMLFHRKSISQP